MSPAQKKQVCAPSAHTCPDLHADADGPPPPEAGCGRPSLGPSQPGTQAPSRSGSCHLYERGARELPLSPHSLNRGQYTTKIGGIQERMRLRRRGPEGRRCAGPRRSTGPPRGRGRGPARPGAVPHIEPAGPTYVYRRKTQKFLKNFVKICDIYFHGII